MNELNPLTFENNFMPRTAIPESRGDSFSSLQRNLSRINRSNRGFGPNTVVIFPGDDIQNAIESLNKTGGGRVILKNGIHKLANNITLYSKISLDGESASGVITDFNSGSFGINAAGTDVYTTGTIITIASGVLVEGSGTSWLTNVTAGQHIFIGTRWYEIASVTDDTNLVLAEGYGDNVTLPATYRIATVIDNLELKNIKVINSAVTGIALTDCRKVLFDNNISQDNNKGAVFTNISEFNNDRFLAVSNTDNGIELTNMGLSDWESVNSISNGGHNFVLNNVKTMTFFPIAANLATSDGINITTGVDLTILFEASGNGGQGVELVSGCDNITLFNSVADDNTSDGIKLTATSDNCSILNCNFKNNGGYGWNVAASSCDNNYFIKNRFSSNTLGRYSDSGTDTFVDEDVEVILYKLADQTSTSASLENDDHFTFEVEANTDYAFDARLFYVRNSAVNANFNFNFSLPSGATYDAQWSAGNLVAPSTVSEAADALAATAQDVDRVGFLSGVIKIGGTAGTVTFQWAPKDATSSIKIYKGSWLKYKKLI